MSFHPRRNDLAHLKGFEASALLFACVAGGVDFAVASERSPVRSILAPFVARPGAPNSFLFLVVRPGAPFVASFAPSWRMDIGFRMKFLVG